jgi:hypothetical protein
MQVTTVPAAQAVRYQGTTYPVLSLKYAGQTSNGAILGNAAGFIYAVVQVTFATTEALTWQLQYSGAVPMSGAIVAAASSTHTVLMHGERTADDGDNILSRILTGTPTADYYIDLRYIKVPL